LKQWLKQWLKKRVKAKERLTHSRHSQSGTLLYTATPQLLLKATKATDAIPNNSLQSH
jgi:hypothetical protein